MLAMRSTGGWYAPLTTHRDERIPTPREFIQPHVDRNEGS
jgi:hypothetical protein